MRGKFGIWLALGCVLAALSAGVLAHGDVTPHPVDTTGLKPLGSEWLAENPYRGNKLAIERGAEGYLHNCAGCHGLNAVSGGMAPDLLLLAKDCFSAASASQKAACLKDSDEYYKGITLNGKTRNGKVYMPEYKSVFTQEAVWAVKAYLDARTDETAK